MLNIRAWSASFLENLRKFADGALSVTIVVSIVAMILATLMLVMVTVAQVTTSLNQPSPHIVGAVSDYLLSWMAVDPKKITGNQYSTFMAAFAGSVSVIVTLWFSFFTTIAYIKYRRTAKRTSLVQFHPVRQSSDDDLDVMDRYYRGADSIVVFSSHFSWLATSHPLILVVEALAKAKRIRFVSSKSESEVKQAVGANFSKFKGQFKFDSKRKIKCSLIQRGHSKVLLYLADTSLNAGGEKKVCVISGKDDAQYLLDTIHCFCEEYIP